MLYDQFVTNSIEKRLDSANNEEQRKMYSNFSESRKALLENGHLKDIFLNQDEKLCFKVCIQWACLFEKSGIYKIVVFKV